MGDDVDMIDGATTIARALKQLGIKYMFGVVGIPVIPVAVAAQAEGIEYYGMRNEQAASYAAGIIGYLTGTPGVCLCVSGPGVIHGIAGLANNWSNNWPLLLLGGANDSFQDGMQAFQETPQIESVRPFVKYAARPDQIARIPFFLEHALRKCMYGRPGCSYIDLPGNLISGSVPEDSVRFYDPIPAPPVFLAPPEEIQRTLQVLRSAKRPLVIVGKGAAYGRAENQVRQLVESLGVPYLPTPMGKGVIPDDHPQCVAAARSQALLKADVVVLLGARLNWILHFGLAPRFQPDVKFIQIDISPEEMHTNVRYEVALVGHIAGVCQQLVDGLKKNPFQYDRASEWWKFLTGNQDKNRRITEAMMASKTVPMNYYCALAHVQKLIPRDAIIVSEGANTMDISRTVCPNFLPRSRLDAGSYGTMGVGLGFAIAAAVAEPNRKVIVIQGDSAFGFSAMELEVAARYRLPITIVIINNNGIYNGTTELDPDSAPLPNVLLPSAKYEMIADAVGGKGFEASTPEQVESQLAKALAVKDAPTVVNVRIDVGASRKPQQFAWLTQDDTTGKKSPSAEANSARL